MARIPLDPPTEGSNPSKVATGAFLVKAKIMEIEDFCNYPGQVEVKYVGNTWTPELCLKMVIDNGKRQDANFLVSGFFKRNKNTKVITGWNDWKNNFYRFVFELGSDFIEIENSNHSIPNDILQKYVGIEFYYVRYISRGTWDSDKGKQPQYADWQYVFTVNTPMQEITEAFANAAGELSVKVTKGGKTRADRYIYAPELTREYAGSDNADSFNHGANVDNSKLDKPTEEDVI